MFLMTKIPFLKRLTTVIVVESLLLTTPGASLSWAFSGKRALPISLRPPTAAVRQVEESITEDLASGGRGKEGRLPPAAPAGMEQNYQTFVGELQRYIGVTAENFKERYIPLIKQLRGVKELSQEDLAEIDRFQTLLRKTGVLWTDYRDAKTLADLRTSLEFRTSFPGMCYECAEQSAQILSREGNFSVDLFSRRRGSPQPYGESQHYVEVTLAGVRFILEMTGEYYERYEDVFRTKWRPVGMVLMPKKILFKSDKIRWLLMPYAMYPLRLKVHYLPDRRIGSVEIYDQKGNWQIEIKQRPQDLVRRVEEAVLRDGRFRFSIFFKNGESHVVEDDREGNLVTVQDGGIRSLPEAAPHGDIVKSIPGPAAIQISPQPERLPQLFP